MTKNNLFTLADELLEQARGTHAGRAAATVRGHDYKLRETVIALLAGQTLNDHQSPGSATLQVLRGEVRLTVPDGSADLAMAAGDLAGIPDARHGLTADTDAVVLLTVSL